MTQEILMDPVVNHASASANADVPPSTSTSSSNRRKKRNAIKWIAHEEPIPGCPRGMEPLLRTDTLKIKQKIDLEEAFTGVQQNNQYLIKTLEDETLFLAFENSSLWSRLFCGAHRGFVFHLVDDQNLETLRVTRRFKCCGGWFWCAGCCNACAYEVCVESAGEVMGYVRQIGSLWKSKFEILDAEYRCIYKILGPCFILDGPCWSVENLFKIIDNETQTIAGKITKEYNGLVKELLTNADEFVINFPTDIDIRTKATLLGAYILIDLMFYESN